MADHTKHWANEKSTQYNIFYCIDYSYLCLYIKVDQNKIQD